MLFTRLFKSKGPDVEKRLKQTFERPPVLQTERLILRKIVPEDANDMYAYSKDSEVTRYLTWTPHRSVKETERYIKYLQKQYENGSFYDWGVVLRENNRFVGTCGYTSYEREGDALEIGYVLSRDCWGMGYAAEAARCVIQYAFERLHAGRVFAKYMEGNEASACVMRKCGMTFEATYRNSMYIKGEYKTINVYSLSREEYMAQ